MKTLILKFFSPRDRVLFERSVKYDPEAGTAITSFTPINHEIGLNECVGAFFVGMFKLLFGASIPFVFGIVMVIYG